MKRKLWCLFVIFTYCGILAISCGKKGDTTDASGEKNNGKYETIDSYDTFYLEGKKITLPISWSELSGMGFKINTSDKKIISTEKGYVEEEIYNSSGKHLGKVSIANKTDSDIKIKDGIVNVFTFTEDVDMSLYGGLSFSATEDQVYETCGEPMYHVYEGTEKKIRVLNKEQEKELYDDEYSPSLSYRWCKNNWMTSNLVFNSDLGLYTTKSICHYLEITFDASKNINKIVFYFDSADDEEPKNTEQDNSSEIQIISSDNYSDDYAWITYSVDSASYIGCIDKLGTVIVQYQKEEVRKYTEFQNDSACVCFEDGTSSIIDKQGKEIYSPSAHDLGDLSVYGDGYYCFSKSYSNFDESGFTATIIDAKGNVLLSEDDSMLYLGYAGDGVFYGHNLDKTTYWYYNVEKGISYECNEVSPNNSDSANIFENGYSQIELTSGGKNGTRQQALLTSDGKFSVLNMPGENISSWKVGKASENVIVYEGYSDYGDEPVEKLCYYDLKKKKFISMNKYVDKMYNKLISEKIYISVTIGLSYPFMERIITVILLFLTKIGMKS